MSMTADHASASALLHRSGKVVTGWKTMTMQTTTSRPQAEDVPTRFKRLSAEWKAKSRHLSNTAQMAILDPYQRIIGMGWDAVPFILEELRREPDQWFWALEKITDQNPVPPEAAGRVRQMAQAWIDWGRRQGILAS